MASSLPNLHGQKSMSTRIHTKDMAYLNTWMDETQHSTKHKKNSNRSSTAPSSNPVDVYDFYKKSFQLLNSTQAELSRQIGAHCVRLASTSSKHWTAASKLLQNLLTSTSKSAGYIRSLESKLQTQHTLHAAETKQANATRKRLMARVNDAETEVDQLRSDLKTMKHLKKAAIQERIKIEEVLESRLGGGSRSAGGDSNESSNTVLTALERAEKDVTLLQSLEDVVVQMSMERDRRTNLCKCRGMSWFVVVCRGLLWLVVVCRGLSWLVVACRGLSWFVVVVCWSQC